MDLTFIGSGNAFGSGGRFNTCFLLQGESRRLLIDCGATSLVALQRAGIDHNDIDGVVVSHLHGDHFGGLPFLLLDAQHLSKRERPLFLWGPPGLAGAACRGAGGALSRLVAARAALSVGVPRARSGRARGGRGLRGHALSGRSLGRRAVLFTARRA